MNRFDLRRLQIKANKIERERMLSSLYMRIFHIAEMPGQFQCHMLMRFRSSIAAPGPPREYGAYGSM
jgi:hypothetical protein